MDDCIPDRLSDLVRSLNTTLSRDLGLERSRNERDFLAVSSDSSSESEESDLPENEVNDAASQPVIFDEIRANQKDIFDKMQDGQLIESDSESLVVELDSESNDAAPTPRKNG